jgi:hypothetical protein
MTSHVHSVSSVAPDQSQHHFPHPCSALRHTLKCNGNEAETTLILHGLQELPWSVHPPLDESASVTVYMFSKSRPECSQHSQCLIQQLPRQKQHTTPYILTGGGKQEFTAPPCPTSFSCLIRHLYFSEYSPLSYYTASTKPPDTVSSLFVVHKHANK